MKNYKKNQGFVLLVVFLVVFLLLLMAMYFFSFIVTELKISKNQSIAEQTYYLAEAGVEETIWKLKNDNDWKTNFENGNCNPCSFSRSNVFFTNGGYEVSVQSTGEAKGDIIATGRYTFFSGQIAQRIIKIKAFKALNPNPVEQIGIFSGDGNVSFSGTVAEITNGGIFANNDISAILFSNIHATGTASATNDVYVDPISTLDADGSEGYGYGENWPTIVMPMIDFDSSAANSYKYKAQNNYNPPQVYTQQQFADLLKDTPDLTINGITYVTGQVKIKRGQHLTVNGVLVADGSITVGIGWQNPSGTANLTVNNTTGQPSGALTKASFKTGIFGGNINVAGLIYASDSVELDTLLPSALNITGGIIARRIATSSLWNHLNINYDSEIIMTALGVPQYSQVVTVEHWEEQY